MRKIKGTYYLSKSGLEVTEIRALILRRRLQILVHSCIYYKLNNSLITDRQWDHWARELYKLQKEHLSIAQKVDYHKYFKNFDPCTGFSLPLNRPEIVRKAKQLLNFKTSDMA